ncbi:MAG: Stk1 family PASTA domain-containing Ser/Thr kinase [Streptosporangiales bacterium]|nr:Stk1 family PASTA domain-containing Ser/Thr kinase [Streptosporangiales bacterium]
MTQPRLLGGRYELDGVVGRGGMAEVYRARDVRLDRQVAVKTLRADLARDPVFQTRFRREAQSAASLNHPAVIAVYDTGEDTVAGTPVPYIVMEYVEGQTLRDLLHDDRRLLPERALEMVDGILRALDYSHRGGIVHRDIKPANVMLTRTGEVKVMDFGIARALTDASATMTQTAQVIGTAQYLSPEQARGERVDSRSDIYSTGCVLYELLTGQPPFTGDSPVAIAYQHVREDPVPPSQLDPEMPSYADAIVLKAMAKDPDERYQSATEMRTDITRALSGIPVDAAATMPVTAATQRLSPGSATEAMLPPVEDEEMPGRRGHRRERRWAWVRYLLIPLLVAAVAAGLAYWLLADRTAQVAVPDVIGENRASAEQALGEQQLQARFVEEHNARTEEGLVFKTDPPARTQVDEGSTVTVYISRGPRTAQVPDLVGLTRSQAEDRLESSGLKLGSVDRRPSEEQRGTVISSDPPNGAEVEQGSEVDIVVSQGGNTVPNVVGLSSADAQNQLRAAGFNPVVQPRETTQQPPDTVLSQSPSGGATAPQGSTVTIVVVQQPEPTEFPTPPPSTEDDGFPLGGSSSRGNSR